MQRRNFDIYEPFREIKKEDSLTKFESKLLNSCGSTLTSMYSDSKDNYHVWVYDADNILGIISFQDLETKFYIDIVSNNFCISKDILNQTEPGTTLYYVVEDVAKQNGVSKITLDSIPDRTGYWELLGFSLTGTPFRGKFCMLYPMEKIL